MSGRDRNRPPLQNRDWKSMAIELMGAIRISLKNKARRERFELPALWFEASRGQNPNGLFGGAYETRNAF
jgi:hypothetical protein